MIDPIEKLFLELMDLIKESKPLERSEKARRFAILITMLEQADAFYRAYINSDDLD